jgi:Tol biopolymer transport system component
MKRLILFVSIMSLFIGGCTKRSPQYKYGFVGDNTIYLSDGEKTRKLVDNAFDPSLSPDGTKIVFSRDSIKEGGHNQSPLVNGPADLWIIGVDGSNLHRLAKTKFSEIDPQWSPDGKVIAYLEDTGSGFPYNLCFIDPTGKTTQFNWCLQDEDKGQTRKTAAFSWLKSPQGGSQSLIVTSFNYDAWNLSPIFRVNTDGVWPHIYNIYPLTEGTRGRAILSRDETKFAYGWEPAMGLGATFVFVEKIDRSEQKKITFDGNIFPVDWSPDGEKLLIQSTDDTGNTIVGGYPPGLYVINADGSNPNPVAIGAESPAGWSPDGKEMFYTRCGAEYNWCNLYLLDSTTGKEEEVTPQGKMNTGFFFFR